MKSGIRRLVAARNRRARTEVAAPTETSPETVRSFCSQLGVGDEGVDPPTLAGSIARRHGRVGSAPQTGSCPTSRRSACQHLPDPGESGDGRRVAARRDAERDDMHQLVLRSTSLQGSPGV